MAAFGYEYSEDTGRMRINCVGSLFGASVEDYDSCMALVIDRLLEVKKATSVVLAREREYEYGPEQTKILREIANVIEDSIREKLMTVGAVGVKNGERYFPELSSRLQYLVIDLMRRDPIGAYVELSRELREVNIKLKKDLKREEHEFYSAYKDNILEVLIRKLEATQMIQAAKPHTAGYHLGDRALYRQIFSPMVRPNFMLTRYMIIPPERAKSVEKYSVGDFNVEIFRTEGSAEYFYYVLPPEFRLSEEKYTILDAARRYMATHRPKTAEFVRSEKVRENFYNIGKDMIRDTAEHSGISLQGRELDQLSSILTRYTAGMGVLDILIADEKVQDIYVNSPIDRQPIMINHADYEECKTNLIPTTEDAEGWATRLRIQSGRPLDEANPVLDTDVDAPGGRARFCVITRSLSPQGLGFAIRRHRDKPWTLPLFIKAKMLNPMAAGLLSFLVDGMVSILVAGGRGAGKTSMLASLMLEMLPKTRIVTIQDSVTGDCEMLFEKNGKLCRDTIGNLVDSEVKTNGTTELGREISRKNPGRVNVFSITKNGKVKLSPVTAFIRHKVEKDVYEVTTRTGRKLKVTGDHSLFSMGGDGRIAPIECRKLKTGDYVVTPRVLHFSGSQKEINLMEHLEKLDGFYLVSPLIGNFVKENKDAIYKLAKKHSYYVTGKSKGITQHWKRENVIPAEIALELERAGVKIPREGLMMKMKASSSSIPARIPLDNDFLTFAGLWLADGCYHERAGSVIISVVDERERDVVKSVAGKFGLPVKMHSDGISLMINSKPLKRVMKDVLELKGDSFTKRIPEWVYGLSRKQAGCVLKGLFSGDGCVSDKEIVMSLRSENLVKDAQTLLLGSGVIGRCNERDGFYHCRISSLESLRAFRDGIGILQEKKLSRLEALCEKVSTHDSTDIVPLPFDVKLALRNHSKSFSATDYLTRGNNVGRSHLAGLLSSADFGDYEDVAGLASMAESDIFWDSVKSVRKVKHSGVYVYDISVPENENFICENVLAHNTLELPVEQMIELKYNIENLKSRSVLTMVQTEMSADEALRTSLRLGDSALIVGEIRSVEAKALWEAMRIGALSNVVAGTIHGESPYGVYDRVVNDLGVPNTSFKATDIIPICRTLRSADGMHRYRRMTEITEIRKDWDTNPAKENGFVPLMMYSAKEDTLKPTDTLVNGESEILNRIASYVKEWSGNWELVWENIKLRAKIKKTIVELAEKMNRPDLMEAEMMVKSNSWFHIFSEQVSREVGAPEAQRIYDLWFEWFRTAAKV